MEIRDLKLEENPIKGHPKSRSGGLRSHQRDLRFGGFGVRDSTSLGSSRR